MYYALALVGIEPEAAEARLRDAERLLETALRVNKRSEAPSAEIIVKDDEGFRSLPGTIAIVRAYRAGALGDVPGIVRYARRA
ncbi:MAG: hypothetical protein HYY09_04050 [Firmicutes bacterium]|nr:hypothetical protein [Bacillota bacterium]